MAAQLRELSLFKQVTEDFTIQHRLNGAGSGGEEVDVLLLHPLLPPFLPLPPISFPTSTSNSRQKMAFLIYSYPTSAGKISQRLLDLSCMRTPISS